MNEKNNFPSGCIIFLVICFFLYIIVEVVLFLLDGGWKLLVGIIIGIILFLIFSDISGN